MTARELYTWWTLYQMEPWGDHRSDLRATATLATQSGAANSRTLWPYWPEPSPDDIVNQFHQL